MDAAALIAQLSDPDAARRADAKTRLCAAGSSAVPPLVAALRQETSERPYDVAMVLRRIGRPAVGPLVAELAGLAEARAGTARQWCSFALRLVLGGGNGSADLDQDLIAALAHRTPHVRVAAVLALENRRTFSREVLGALLELLADRHPEVRAAVTKVFVGLGERAVPDLQYIRSSGPGRLRPGALRVLAEIAGDRGLLPVDLAAVERLVRVKLGTESDRMPEGPAILGHWLALPGADQAAVLDALDLVDARPATMRLGYAATLRDAQRGPVAGKPWAERVFVTARLDGWTLVVGPWYGRWGGWHWYPDACRELSTTFGAAHAYSYGGSRRESAWLICEDGQIRRWLDPEDHTARVGARLPVERTRKPDAFEVAAAMSTSPTGPHTVREGDGLLAFVRNSAGLDTPPGALPI
ncbi:HEAT repeat domain-containing protein [Dactylosporangium siamense]|uniref:HEAT repeat domain-containing protein n=1 Tax=Dactylosporangium siamense TaxID=685454 RepID=A0A919Q0Z8_9ACTN|nr:HEAT repeat domain-containing protein [Dactylosporangium siamense]GIG52203.1 hypothetical protein Dsi01nite_102440 [Dactylosporangium siamense]